MKLKVQGVEVGDGAGRVWVIGGLRAAAPRGTFNANLSTHSEKYLFFSLPSKNTHVLFYYFEQNLTIASPPDCVTALVVMRLYSSRVAEGLKCSHTEHFWWNMCFL